MKKAVITSMILSVVITFFACSKSDSDDNSGGNNTIDCSGTAKTFSGDVNPLIQTFCNQANCHASGSTNGPGPITNYAQVFNARSAIRSAVASGFMPRNTTLNAAQKAAIICWIDSGAQNN
jgi:hypothetical protein